MIRKMTFVAAALVLAAATAASAAPIVTLLENNGAIRSQAQGAGTYKTSILTILLVQARSSRTTGSS